MLLATSDSFPSSEQTSSNNNRFEEINYNSTEEIYANELKSDNKNDIDFSSDVFQELSKNSDRTPDDSFVDSRTESSQVETAIEPNEIFSEESVDKNIDTNTVLAEAVLLDSISTNSGING